MIKKLIIIFSGILVFLDINVVASNMDDVNGSVKKSVAAVVAGTSNNEITDSEEVTIPYTIPNEFSDDIKNMYAYGNNIALNEIHVPACSVAANMGMIGYVMHDDVRYYSYLETLLTTYLYDLNGKLKNDDDKTIENSDFGGGKSMYTLYKYFENYGLYHPFCSDDDQTNFQKLNDQYANIVYDIAEKTGTNNKWDYTLIGQVLDGSGDTYIKDFGNSANYEYGKDVMSQLSYHSLFEEGYNKSGNYFYEKYPDSYKNQSNYIKNHPNDKDLGESNYDYGVSLDDSNFKSEIIKSALDKGEKVMIMMNYLYHDGKTGHQDSYCKYNDIKGTLDKYTENPYGDSSDLDKCNNTFDYSKYGKDEEGNANSGYYYNTASHCVFIFGYAKNGDDIIFLARNSWGPYAHDKGNSYLTADFIDGHFWTKGTIDKDGNVIPPKLLPIVKYANAMRKDSSVEAI